MVDPFNIVIIAILIIEFFVIALYIPLVSLLDMLVHFWSKGRIKCNYRISLQKLQGKFLTKITHRNLEGYFFKSEDEGVFWNAWLLFNIGALAILNLLLIGLITAVGAKIVLSCVTTVILLLFVPRQLVTYKNALKSKSNEVEELKERVKVLEEES